MVGFLFDGHASSPKKEMKRLAIAAVKVAWG